MGGPVLTMESCSSSAIAECSRADTCYCTERERACTNFFLNKLLSCAERPRCIFTSCYSAGAGHWLVLIVACDWILWALHWVNDYYIRTTMLADAWSGKCRTRIKWFDEKTGLERECRDAQNRVWNAFLYLSRLFALSSLLSLGFISPLLTYRLYSVFFN